MSRKALASVLERTIAAQIHSSILALVTDPDSVLAARNPPKHPAQTPNLLGIATVGTRKTAGFLEDSRIFPPALPLSFELG